MHLHRVPKNETRVILNILCTVVSLLQWNLACDIPMTLAIKRVHNLPPHLSYFSTLPDITQNRNTALASCRSRCSFTLGTVFLRASSTEPLTSGKHGCAHVQRQRDVTLNTYCDLATQPAHFRATYTPNRFFSEPLTLSIGRQHKFSFFCVMLGSVET